MPRGRPRKPGKPVVVRVLLRLWPGEDDDLIRLLSGSPRARARLIKAALRGADVVRQAAEEVGPSEDQMLDALGGSIW